MTSTAIIMMIISMVTIWGGLIAAVIHLARHPEATDSDAAPPVEL